MTTASDAFQQQVFAARRAQILDAAGRAISEKGYRGATIRDIASKAGVSDGTIYNYFENKEDLLRSLLDRLHHAEGQVSVYPASAGVDLASYLTLHLRRRMMFLMANNDLFRALLPELLANPELQEIYYQQMVRPSLELSEMFLKGRVAGEQWREGEVALIARGIAAIVYGLLMMQFMGDQMLTEQWSELPELISNMLTHGLANH